MTGVKYYRDLLTEQTRIDAFRRAIRAVVRPGDRVLDVGTGLGTFAFFAADAGASKVWGVDGNPIIHVAKTVARINGYGDRVEFVRGVLPDVTPPTPCDVIMFEDFSPRLLDGRIVNLVNAVHRTWAAPGARFIPAAATLYAAPVSSSELWREIVPFEHGEERLYGIDWEASREYVANDPLKVAIPPGALAAEPAEVAVLEFNAPLDASGVAASLTWRLERSLTIHGLAYWFDLDLGAGERLSNAPGVYPGSWGHLFLPADPPLDALAGQALSAAIRSDPLGGDRLPGWLAWEVGVPDAVRRGHEFRAAPASFQDLSMTSPDGVPRLSRRSEMEAHVLALTDGHRSVRDIAAALLHERRDLSSGEALRLVVDALRGKIVVSERFDSKGAGHE